MNVKKNFLYAVWLIRIRCITEKTKKRSKITGTGMVFKLPIWVKNLFVFAAGVARSCTYLVLVHRSRSRPKKWRLRKTGKTLAWNEKLYEIITLKFSFLFYKPTNILQVLYIKNILYTYWFLNKQKNVIINEFWFSTQIFLFLTLTAVMKIEFTFNKSVLLMKRQRQAVAQDQIDQLVLHGSRNATNSQCCGSKYVVHGIWI